MDKDAGDSLDQVGPMRKGAVMALDDHLIIGVEEAAQIIGVSARTIRRWAANGELPPVRKFDGRTGKLVFEAGVVRRKAQERRQRRAS